MTAILNDFTEVEPIFTISEAEFVGLPSDIKVGQRIKVVFDYKAIEKTRSFTMFNMKNITFLPQRRAV